MHSCVLMIVKYTEHKLERLWKRTAVFWCLLAREHVCMTLKMCTITSINTVCQLQHFIPGFNSAVFTLNDRVSRLHVLQHKHFCTSASPSFSARHPLIKRLRIYSVGPVYHPSGRRVSAVRGGLGTCNSLPRSPPYKPLSSAQEISLADSRRHLQPFNITSVSFLSTGPHLWGINK